MHPGVAMPPRPPHCGWPEALPSGRGGGGEGGDGRAQATPRCPPPLADGHGSACGESSSQRPPAATSLCCAVLCRHPSTAWRAVPSQTRACGRALCSRGAQQPTRGAALGGGGGRGALQGGGAALGGRESKGGRGGDGWLPYRSHHRVLLRPAGHSHRPHVHACTCACARSCQRPQPTHMQRLLLASCSRKESKNQPACLPACSLRPCPASAWHVPACLMGQR